MRALIAIIVLVFSLNSFASNSDLYVQIRSDIAPVSTEQGQSFFGSYLYALVTGSSVKTELFFTGEGKEVINIIGKLFENDNTNTVEIAGIGYVASRDRIDLILIDNACASMYEREDCLLATSIYRLKK